MARGMTYGEAIEATVTKAMALAEFKRHGMGPDESDEWDLFIVRHGDRPDYPGEAVLSWIGY